MKGARPPRGEEGFALLVALALAIVLGALAMSVASRMTDLARDGNRERSTLSALWAAGGGVEAARAALARDPGWTGATLTVEGVEVRVTAERIAESPATFRVVSLASARDARRRVEAVLLARPEALPSIASWQE